MHLPSMPVRGHWPAVAGYSWRRLHVALATKTALRMTAAPVKNMLRSAAISWPVGAISHASSGRSLCCLSSPTSPSDRASPCPAGAAPASPASVPGVPPRHDARAGCRQRSGVSFHRYAQQWKWRRYRWLNVVSRDSVRQKRSRGFRIHPRTGTGSVTVPMCRRRVEPWPSCAISPISVRPRLTGRQHGVLPVQGDGDGPSVCLRRARSEAHRRPCERPRVDFVSVDY